MPAYTRKRAGISFILIVGVSCMTLLGDSAYATDRLSDEAVQSIRNARTRPFVGLCGLRWGMSATEVEEKIEPIQSSISGIKNSSVGQSVIWSGKYCNWDSTKVTAHVCHGHLDYVIMEFGGTTGRVMETVWKSLVADANGWGKADRLDKFSDVIESGYEAFGEWHFDGGGIVLAAAKQDTKEAYGISATYSTSKFGRMCHEFLHSGASRQLR